MFESLARELGQRDPNFLAKTMETVIDGYQPSAGAGNLVDDSEQGGTRMVLRRKLSLSLSAATMLAGMMFIILAAMLFASAAPAQTSEGSASASASATASPNVSVTATAGSTAAATISAASSVPPSATASASPSATATATTLTKTGGLSYLAAIPWVAALVLGLSGLAALRLVLRRRTTS
jgi:hypothetical protein